MEELGSIINNIARLAVYIFGGMSVLAVCYAGFLYMTAAGDPQKSSQARNALFAAFGGMIIVGLAFLAPRIISTAVLEPAGGESVAGTSGTDCDSVLRNQLVRQQAAGGKNRMNQIVAQIQQRQSEDCSKEIWDPWIVDPGEVLIGAGTPGGPGCSSLSGGTNKWPGCGAVDIWNPEDDHVGDCATGKVSTIPNRSFSERTIGGIQVPSGLERFSTNDPVTTGRDGQNNIVVYFDDGTEHRPGDGALCWMYVQRLQTWVAGTQPGA